MGDAGAVAGSAMEVASNQIISQNQIAQQEKQEQENRSHAMKIAEMNIAMQKETNAQNQANWEKSFAYQQQLNQKQMEREDNAVGRRAEDLQNNGFNRLMAVATAADSGQMTTISGGQESQAAQIQAYAKKVNYQRERINIINNMIGQAQVGKIKAETQYIGEQIMSESEDRALTKQKQLEIEYNNAKTAEERKKIEKEIETLAKDLEIKAHNLGIGQKYKLPVGMDWRPNNAYQAGSQAASYANDAAQEAAKNHKPETTASDGRKIIYFQNTKDGIIVDGKWFKNNKEARKYYPYDKYVYREK